MRVREKINPKKHKQGFIEYVLYHPQAFAVVFRMAIIVPILLMIAWSVYNILNENWVILPVSVLMLGVSGYSAWHNRNWFKTDTNNTIANTVYNIDKKRKSYDDWKKTEIDEEVKEDGESKD
jgi:hypothetical protein